MREFRSFFRNSICCFELSKFVSAFSIMANSSSVVVRVVELSLLNKNSSPDRTSKLVLFEFGDELISVKNSSYVLYVVLNVFASFFSFVTEFDNCKCVLESIFFLFVRHLQFSLLNIIILFH